MSSPQLKVNPPLCDICMSSADVWQEPYGAWHCRKQRCLRQQRYKPIMVTSIDKDEPVSPGFLNRLWSFLTRDLSDDRRPKHPRPAGAPMPQVSRPAPRPPQNIDVGKPPRGGSGVLPEPPPDDIDEIHSTGSERERTFVPKLPKMPTIDDDPKLHVERNHGETARAYRDERRRQGGVPMNQEDGPLSDPKKRKGGIPAEFGWAKRKEDPETSSAWTAIKWIIGVGASISLGWLIEWVIF